MERIYFSINKLMNYINDNKPFEKYFEPTSISLWFETNETFLNRFNQIVIKPIALTLRTSDKSVTLTHQTLLNVFDNKQPLVSFSKNKKRSVSKSKNGELMYLSIDMIKKELDGKEYYPSRTGFTSNKSVVQNILTKRIAENEDDDINVTEFI